MFCARPSTSNRSSSLDAGRSRFRGDFRIRVGVPQITPLSTSDNKAVAEGEGFEPPVPLRAQRFSRPPVSTAHASLRSRVLSAVYQPWIYIARRDWCGSWWNYLPTDVALDWGRPELSATERSGLYTGDELERVAAEKHTYPWPLPKSTNSQKLALSSKPAALSIAQSDTMQLVRFSEQAGISLTIRPVLHVLL